MTDSSLAALGIFVGTYAVIAFGRVPPLRVDRAGAAIIGAVLMVEVARLRPLVTRRVKPEKIYRQIDWDLLVLFIGLFVVVEGLERAGHAARFFALLEPIGIASTWGLAVSATILSNAISNVPAVMLFARVVPQLPDPETAWLALAMSSTLAGNLTLVGSIANLIVLEGARRQGETIRFAEYLKVGVPVTVATLAFGIWWLG